MNTTQDNIRSRAAGRCGYTFVELVVSLASASIIVGGLSSSLYIAGRSLDQDGTARRASADQILDRFVADVEHAYSFSERTASAVTFSVPDRDGNGRPETIRYAWSGAAGDPLTYEYNGSAAEKIATDVHNFNLAAMTRLLEAAVIPPSEGGGKLLLVVSDEANPTAQDLTRQALIESWGYTVTLIDDGASQADFDTAVAASDVAYVSEEIASGTLGTKLRDATIGVVIEEEKIHGEFGISSSEMTFTEDSIDITDNTHYITTPFSLGEIAFAASPQPVGAPTGTLAPGLSKLALQPSSGTGMLDVIDKGAALYDSGTAAGRRVKLPWGGNDFDINSLTSDGQTIMQRSIAWAAGAGGIAAGPLLLVVSDAANPSAQEIARQSLMQSWGYTVTLLDDDATTLELANAMAVNDVVYISLEITNLTVMGKLRDATLGVVNEEFLLSSDLGFGAGTGAGFFNDINIVDNTHYITSVVSPGALALLNPTYGIYTGTSSTLAPGADLLGRTGSITGLMALEKGASLHGGGTALGRRVLVPWGADFAALNAVGQTLLRRAIEWAAQETALGPIAHWKLDDGTGTSAIDSVGGHDGALANGPVWVAGQLGDALDFDGSDDYVDLTSDEELDDVFVGGATVMAWINPASWGGNGYGRIFDKSSSPSATGDGWAIRLNKDNGGLNFGQGFTSGRGWWRFAESSINFNTWQHVALAYDASSTANDPIVYLNGSPVAVTRVDTPSGDVRSDTAINLRLGSHASLVFNVFDGQIDDARIYGRMLDSAEIAAAAAAAGGGGGAPFIPNFGYETQFASTFQSGNGVQVGTQVTLPQDGTLNSITAYIDPRGKNFRYAIYSANAGEPGNLIVESAVDSQSGVGWKTINVTPTPLTAGTYWLALSFSHGTQKYYYESSGGTTRHKLHNAVTNGFIAVWPGSTTPYPYKVSIYGTCTPTP